MLVVLRLDTYLPPSMKKKHCVIVLYTEPEDVEMEDGPPPAVRNPLF